MLSAYIFLTLFEASIIIRTVQAIAAVMFNSMCGFGFVSAHILT